MSCICFGVEKAMAHCLCWLRIKNNSFWISLSALCHRTLLISVSRTRTRNHLQVFLYLHAFESQWQCMRLSLCEQTMCLTLPRTRFWFVFAASLNKFIVLRWWNGSRTATIDGTQTNSTHSNLFYAVFAPVMWWWIFAFAEFVNETIYGAYNEIEPIGNGGSLHSRSRLRHVNPCALQANKWMRMDWWQQYNGVAAVDLKSTLPHWMYSCWLTGRLTVNQRRPSNFYNLFINTY